MSGSSGFPSTLPFATTLTMSLVGCARRLLAISWKYWNSSARDCSMVSFTEPPRWNSGSCGAIVSLVQRKSRSQSSRGTPSISAITAIVILAETSRTKSQCSSRPASSSTSRVMRSTCGASADTARGVNCLAETFRYRP